MDLVAPEPAPARWQQGIRSAALVLASYAGGLVLLYAVLEAGPHGGWRWADIAVGAVACGALLLSRRAPVAVALVLAAVAALVASAGVANMVGLYFVARYRPLPTAIAVAAADVLAGWLFWLLYPGNQGLPLTLTVNVAITAAVTAWGALIQSQRALVEVYRERAERAEAEKVLREEHIRSTERTRIAREMHDVVAHRISLVALHAGGLEVAPGQDADEVRAAAALIRSSAVDALDELRVAIGILREDEPRSLEQPGFDRLEDLVRDARSAGQDVVLDLGIGTPGPPGLGRDVYRIVQEGLTNARKHAPGAPVRVTVRRDADEARVVVVNGCGGRSLGVPGTGTGLIGLAERASLAGGSLRHGPDGAGSYTLEARLPWR
ncbi:histidine kinase [Nocardioides maradonensis]